MKSTPRMNRRGFLKLAGIAGAAASLPLVSPAIGLADMGRKLHVAQQTRMMMGTLVSVTVIDSSPSLAQDAMNKTFNRMASLTPIFDRHSGSGLLNALNTSGSISGMPAELSKVLDLCHSVHRFSGGAFDITVAPIIDAYRQSFAASGHAPSKNELQAAMSTMGGVSVNGNAMAITRQGAGVTLDGVAKGYLVDQGLAAAKAAGASHVLINAGGDVGVLGDRGNGQPWRVAVSDPAEPSKAKAVISLTSGAVATSGNYEVYFDRDKLYHHIIDPATGASPRMDTSVSVRAGSAAMADALSTACFVMKPKDARKLLSANKGLDGMILTRHGQRYMTEGFAG